MIKNNVLNKIRKIVALGAVVAGLSVVPSFADETPYIIEENNTVIETVLETIEETVVEETVVESTIDTAVEENTRVEDSVSSDKLNLEALALELEGKTFTSKEELDAFCKANGYSFTRNTNKDSLNGESYFYVLICGSELKVEVIVNPVVDGVEDEVIEEEEVNHDDIVVTLPDDILVEEEVNHDDIVVTLPDDFLVEEEVNHDDLVVTLPDDFLVEEEVNHDDLVVTLPDDILVEEEVNYDDLIMTLPGDFLIEEEVNYDDLIMTLPGDFLIEETLENEEPSIPEFDEEKVVNGVTDEVIDNNEVSNNNDNGVSLEKDIDFMVNPKTGDTSSIITYLVVAILASICLVIVNRRFHDK